MSVILSTWETEIWRIVGHIVLETPSPKYPEQNGLEIWLKWRKPQSQQKQTNKKTRKEGGKKALLCQDL
jgi:hypothetical protein